MCIERSRAATFIQASIRGRFARQKLASDYSYIAKHSTTIQDMFPFEGKTPRLTIMCKLLDQQRPEQLLQVIRVLAHPQIETVSLKLQELFNAQGSLEKRAQLAKHCLKLNLDPRLNKIYLEAVATCSEYLEAVRTSPNHEDPAYLLVQELPDDLKDQFDGFNKGRELVELFKSQEPNDQTYDQIKDILKVNKEKNYAFFEQILNVLESEDQDQEGLAQLLCGAIELENKVVMNIILKSDKFNEIPADGRFGLSHALCEAANKGQVEVMKVIIESVGIDKLPADGRFGLGEALCFAARSGHIEAMKLIIEGVGVTNFPVGGPFGLGEALCFAAEQGEVEAMKLIIESVGVTNFPVEGQYGLSHALRAAAREGKIEAMKLIIESVGIDKLPVEGYIGLGNALCCAAGEGQVEAMKLIIESVGIDKLPVEGDYGLGNALCWAAHSGRLEVMTSGQVEAMTLVIKSVGVTNFPVRGQYGLMHALSCAAKSGQVNGMQEIIQVLKVRIEDYNNQQT